VGIRSAMGVGDTHTHAGRGYRHRLAACILGALDAGAFFRRCSGCRFTHCFHSILGAVLRMKIV